MAQHTAVLALADGTLFWGRGVGATGRAVGEVCFNTSQTGYQEIMTDPSYAGQIINFTFPHIGNVGSNAEDIETMTPAARGCVVSADITEPGNWRSAQHFDAWLKSHKLVGMLGTMMKYFVGSSARPAPISHSLSVCCPEYQVG